MAVIEGRADEPLVRDGGRTWSHARLLEEVAALGGVLRHLGVEPGTPVHVDLAPEHGVEAVYVSNHGGRQLDHGRGAIEALPEVVRAVEGRAQV